MSKKRRTSAYDPSDADDEFFRIVAGLPAHLALAEEMITSWARLSPGEGVSRAGGGQQPETSKCIPPLPPPEKKFR
jgi:hypothetical protein